MKKVGVIIAAAGSGTRMKSELNKVLLPLAGIPILVRSIMKFTQYDWVEEIVVVVKAEDETTIAQLMTEWNITKLKRLVVGGEQRQDSVYAGLQALDSQLDAVMIHDAARPLIRNEDLERIYQALDEHDAVGIAVPVKDTIKQVDDNLIITQTPDRNTLWAIQTPQAFSYNLIMQAYGATLHNGWQVTDDCALVEKLGHRVKLVSGSYTNIKITTPEDMLTAKAFLQEDGGEQPMIRTGFGYDVHQLVADRELVLAGVKIEHSLGLLGHSDADVVTHVIMDALLGAAALGDIGKHFPDNDPQYEGISSLVLLAQVVDKLNAKNLHISNIDVTIMAQKPKLLPYIPQMCRSLAEVLQIAEDQINIKATTTEKLGFVGREEGIAAQAVATVY